MNYIPTSLVSKLTEATDYGKLNENLNTALGTVSPNELGIYISTFIDYDRMLRNGMHRIPFHTIRHDPVAVETYKLILNACSEGLETGAILLQNFE